MNAKEILNDFIKTLPPVEAFYGYGSGVIKQVGKNTSGKQLDGIGVVKNTREFHIKNMKLNPKYYSLTAKAYFLLVPTKLQSFGADICYIPYINFNGNLIKMGIIKDTHFANDQRTYENMYMSGRMQKEVLPIVETKSLSEDIKYNRNSALLISLIMMDNKSSLYDLYYTLTSLSYLKDIRNIFGYENPNKINNLVAGSYLAYNQMYLNSDNKHLFEIDKIPFFNADHIKLETDKNKYIIDTLKTINIKKNIDNIYTSVDTLPLNLKLYLDDKDMLQEKYITDEEKSNLRKYIIKYFENINLQVTAKQAIKGLVITGFSNSLKYLDAKKSKIKELR